MDTEQGVVQSGDSQDVTKRLAFVEGITKYLNQWCWRNEIEDLKRARNCLDLLIDLEDSQRGGL